MALGQVPLPWDGPLAPVDAGRLIVAASCTRDHPLQWSRELRNQAHGMEPGERVWLLTRSGAVSVRLGEPTCYAGECRGDYAALELPTKQSTNVVAVVPFRFLASPDRVRPLSLLKTDDGSCVQPPTLEWTADVCRIFGVSNNGQLHVQTERRSTQNGGDMIRTHARMTTRGRSGRWQLVSTSTSAMNPEALVVRQGSESVLWRQIVGIGGPAEITVVLSRVELDDVLTFGRRYSAGGQPCD